MTIKQQAKILIMIRQGWEHIGNGTMKKDGHYSWVSIYGVVTY